jgi:GTPase SAR1 family protein
MELKKFVPNFDKNKNFSMSICASRRSGKTTLLKYFCKNFFDNMFDEIIMICPTIHNDIYNNLNEKIIKITEFDGVVIDALIELQKENNNEKKILIILDDSVGSRVKYSQQLLKLFCVGRNLNISIVYIVQSSTLLLPDHKENLDYMIIMKTKTQPKIEHLIEVFLLDFLENNFKTLKDEKKFYRTLIKENTENHGAIIIDYINDDIFKFKVEKID